MLIATGQAKCVRCSGDILEEYFDVTSIGTGMTPIIKAPPLFENEEEKVIYTALENGNNTIDLLLSATTLSMTDILTTLALLEIRGILSLTEMGK